MHIDRPSLSSLLMTIVCTLSYLRASYYGHMPIVQSFNLYIVIGSTLLASKLYLTRYELLSREILHSSYTQPYIISQLRDVIRIRQISMRTITSLSRKILTGAL